MQKLISRKEAKEQGLFSYFTGKPCPHGHIAPRQISSMSCIECAKGNARRHYIANRSRYIESAKAAYQRDPEAGKQRAKDWAENNKKRVLARDAIYRKSNRLKLSIYQQLCRLAEPEKYQLTRRASNSFRRVRKRQAEGGHTGRDIRRIFKSQRGKCANCGEKLGSDYHVDHVIALVHGGSNAPANLQLLCPACNFAKGAKDPIDFAQEQGRLL